MKPDDRELMNVADEHIDALAYIGKELAASAPTYNDHVELIRFFDGIDKLYERLNDAKKFFNGVYDNLSRERIPEVLREHGVKTITVEGVGRVTVSQRYSCSIIDKDRGFEWLRDNGHGDIITETVNSSTLAAFSKNMMVVEGKELPEDIFKTGTSPFTSVTRK